VNRFRIETLGGDDLFFGRNGDRVNCGLSLAWRNGADLPAGSPCTSSFCGKLFN
jgi:hypothetical protein